MMDIKKKKLFLPLFVVFLMVFSIFGAVIGSFSSDNFVEKIEYEGYDFTYDGTTWFTFKDKQRVESTVDPRLLDRVYTGELANKLVNHKKIYLSMDPNVGLNVEREAFRRILIALTSSSVINACPSDIVGCEDLPLKDCKDSVESEVLVIKIEKGEPNIQEDASCVAIIGDSQHLIMVLEKIRLGALL